MLRARVTSFLESQGPLLLLFMEEQFQRLNLSKEEEEELVFLEDVDEGDAPPDADLCMVGLFSPIRCIILIS